MTAPTTLTPEALAAIAARLDAATAAEHLTAHRFSHGGGRVIQETGPATASGPNLIADFYDPGNREFYMSAPADVRALLAHCEALRERVAVAERDVQIQMGVAEKLDAVMWEQAHSLVEASQRAERAEQEAAEMRAALADVHGLVQAHQVDCRRLVDDWRERARGLTPYKDTESVMERATLLDCASELDAPVRVGQGDAALAATAPRGEGGAE